MAKRPDLDISRNTTRFDIRTSSTRTRLASNNKNISNSSLLIKGIIVHVQRTKSY